MKILHTSDWHLGQNFMGKSREEEHKGFLEWLYESIEKEQVDVLIVAGDIFDTGTPPNYALELYYNFLTKLSASVCKNIIITAGNHDSIATLKAPKQLLEALNVHVITSGDESEDEVIGIYENEELEAVVCGVPFLRDYVVRQALSGESMQDKENALSVGIKEHYRKVHQRAKEFAGDRDIPIIATGHLTTVGSKTSESEREIYIGGTLDIDSDFLGESFEYVALGHLHINQRVGRENVRYSGSPIALSFSESTTQKKVNLIAFEKKKMEIEELNIPLFRPLVVLRGDAETILGALQEVSDKESWIEVHLQDENPFYANQLIREKAKELELTLLALKIDKTQQNLQKEEFDVISLDELTPFEVFERRMQKDEIEDEVLKKALIENFRIVLDEVDKV
ncbi:exonuclease SbcCD subunit D C-terminal domain-containing protein [Sulfurimonas sp.]